MFGLDELVIENKQEIMDGFLARRLNDPKFASGRVEAYASGPPPTLLYASQSLASKKEDDDKKPKKKKSIKDAKKGDDLDGDGHY